MHRTILDTAVPSSRNFVILPPHDTSAYRMFWHAYEYDASYSVTKTTVCAQAAAAPAAADAVESTGRDPRCPAYTVTLFDKTSLTNVAEESPKLWVYVIGVYAITIIVLTMLWMHYRQSINWRILYLSWMRRGDSGHTVLVKDIPTPMMPSTKGCLPKLPDVCFTPCFHCSLLG